MEKQTYDGFMSKFLRLFGYNTSFTELEDKFYTPQLRVIIDDIASAIEEARRVGLELSEIELMPEYRLFEKLHRMRRWAMLVEQKEGEDISGVRERLVRKVEEIYDVKLPNAFKELIEVVPHPVAYPGIKKKIYVANIKGVEPGRGRFLIRSLLLTVWLTKHPDAYQKLLKLKRRLDEELRDIVGCFRVQEEKDGMMKVVSLVEPGKWLRFKWSFSKSSRYNRDYLPFLGSSRNIIATIQVTGDNKLIFKVEHEVENIAHDQGLEIDKIRHLKRGGLSIRLIVGTTRDVQFYGDKKAYRVFNEEVERFIESLLVNVS